MPTETMQTFDPNKMPIFATFCPGRPRPKFKVHSNRAQALNAIKYHLPNGILYKLEDGNWIEIYRVENGNMSKCLHGGKQNYDGTVRWVGLKTDFPHLVSACGACSRA